MKNYQKRIIAKAIDLLACLSLGFFVVRSIQEASTLLAVTPKIIIALICLMAVTAATSQLVK